MATSTKVKGAGSDKFIALFNNVQTQWSATLFPRGDFKDFVQTGSDDLDYFYEPYLVMPRLAELSGWMMSPSKNTNTFLYSVDNIVRILKKVMDSMVIGDGIKVKVYEDFEQKEENEKYTDKLKEWLTSPCGASSDNRGNTINNWVIPKIIKDNITCGASTWYKFIGSSNISPPEEVGKLMLKWIDQRTIVKKFHPFTGWKAVIQYPRVQWGLPKTRSDFDSWNPTVRSMYGEHYNISPATDMPEVHIPSSMYYNFNLFEDAPMNTIIQKIMSKIMLQYLEDRYIEKATFPFFVVKVPRNVQIDTDDGEFKLRLLDIAALLSEFRAGDVFAIEGKEYGISNTGEPVLYAEGWEIIPLEIKSGTINFEDTFRHLNDDIAYGMMSSMAMISSIGVQGRTSSLSTGGQINANMVMIVKDLRKCIGDVFKFIFRDVLYEETGKEIDVRLFDVYFSKIREEDAAQFLNQLISYNGAGALTTNELRYFADRIGMELKPLPPEMTPEGQLILGLDELLNEPEFQIPTSWIEIDSPEIELDKAMDELKQQSETQQFSEKDHLLEAFNVLNKTGNLVKMFESMVDDGKEDEIADCIYKYNELLKKHSKEEKK